MKKILLLVSVVYISLTSVSYANSALENYFKSINQKATDLIYIKNVFSEILLYDHSFTYKNIEYGTLHKHTQPPSIATSRKALQYLELNEDAMRNYGAPSGWSRVEDIRGDEGFRATVFRKSSHIVIAYIGAEVGTSDWITDGISQSGEIASQYTQAVELAEKYISDFPHMEITITGYSLGGALATYAGLLTDKEIVTFNHLSLNTKSVNFIKDRLAMQGYAPTEFMSRVNKILNISFMKEFVTDGDSQEDGDGIFNHLILGNTYYIDDKRFHPLLLDNKLYRHLLPPLKEELTFLSSAYYRVHSYDLNSENNPINPMREIWYFDATLDDLDILLGVSNYILDSIPSLLEDLRNFYR